METVAPSSVHIEQLAAAHPNGCECRMPYVLEYVQLRQDEQPILQHTRDAVLKLLELSNRSKTASCVCCKFGLA
jgi:hypothetical protein